MAEERSIDRDWDGLRLKPAPGPLASVQGFVNTRNVMRGYDLLEDVGGAGAWLTGHGFLDGGVGLDEPGRRRLVEFREGLRGLLVGHNGGGTGESAEVLNELAEDALLRLRFDGEEGAPGLLAAGSGTAAGGVMARLLAVVAGASFDGSWRRLKACRNEGCTWAFHDGSKNRSGSWCTMDVCGSRAKMRAYRRRRSP